MYPVLSPAKDRSALLSHTQKIVAEKAIAEEPQVARE